MSSFAIEVRGYAELALGTRMLAGNILDGAPREFGRAANETAGRVRVPRRTGRLAGSVEGKPIAQGAAVRMGDGVPYAQYVEYGGRGHPHSSGNYLRPAAISAEPVFVDAAVRLAIEEIGDMSWPTP